MFKIFNIGTTCEINSKDLAITADGNIIKYSGSEEYWEFIDNKELVIVSNTDLKKHNLVFTIIEPADFDYIDVYRVNDLFVAHDYNSHHDKEGVWYIVKNIKEFKRNKSNSYSFISYSNNYMEEL